MIDYSAYNFRDYSNLISFTNVSNVLIYDETGYKYEK